MSFVFLHSLLEKVVHFLGKELCAQFFFRLCIQWPFHSQLEHLSSLLLCDRVDEKGDLISIFNLLLVSRAHIRPNRPRSEKVGRYDEIVKEFEGVPDSPDLVSALSNIISRENLSIDDRD